jgi:hypothetical protein
LVLLVLLALLPRFRVAILLAGLALLVLALVLLALLALLTFALALLLTRLARLTLLIHLARTILVVTHEYSPIAMGFRHPN